MLFLWNVRNEYLVLHLKITGEMDLRKITEKVADCAKSVGEFIRVERKSFSYTAVEIKGLNDLVSYVDKTSEKMLVERLSEILPEAGFIVEENTKSETKDYNWIVDPLDGTTNFIHGIPCYAISIALEFKGEIIVGVVYEVAQNECFRAFKNGGAFLNDTKISVSERTKLSDSLIATGFPIYNFSRLDNFIHTLTYLMKNTHGIRRIGAAAADLCYLACGRVDAFFEYNLNPWDVAAGALIVKEAGGTVSDFNLTQNWLFGKEIVATNTHLKEVFEKIINESFKPS
ncbi:MAG: inositol-monophosphatase [Bacteroidetes bacterium]|jgi:myo-inositol-1(or 4)-monophosphatase|nr:inositol-monophosphatase [Bacteroidota bacterium]